MTDNSSMGFNEFQVSTKLMTLNHRFNKTNILSLKV